MILFIPVFILLLFGITIQVLGRTRLNVVQTWIFTIFGAILAWLTFILIKVLGVDPLVTSYITSETSLKFQTIFLVDDKNWVYGFLLLTLLITVLFLDSSRLTWKNNLIAWSGALIVGAAGVLASMSGSVIAFLLTSASIDIFSLSSQIIMQREELNIRKAITDFVLRLTGSFFIMAGLGLVGEPDSLLVSAGLALRLGVFSTGIDIPSSSMFRENLAFLLEMTVSLSALAFMSQLELPNQVFQGKPILVTLLIIYCLSNAIKIIKDFRSQRRSHAWIANISGLVILLLITGHVEAVRPLAFVMCILGGIYSSTISGGERIKIALVILMLGMIGLPYTPSYGIWLTTFLESSIPFVIFYNLFLAFSILVVFFTVITKVQTNHQKDRWVEISSATGPIILLSIPWISVIWIKPVFNNGLDLLNPGIFLSLITFILIYSRSEKLQSVVKQTIKLDHWKENRAGLRIDKFLNFDWVLSFLSFINRGLSNLINILVRVLEGDGGLLWAFVFLILISSILLTYRLFS